MERERQLAISDRGVLRQAKQLLHADVQCGRTSRLIVDGVTIARWRLEVRWCLLFQASFRAPWKQRVESRAEIIGPDFGQPCPANQEWSEPLGRRLGERLVGQIG